MASGADPAWTSTLRALACSATGMVTVSTPCVVAGLEPVGVERLAQHDLAGHRALRPLAGEHLVTLGGGPRPLGLHGEHVALDGEVDRLRRDTREIEAELDRAAVADGVHRHPLGTAGLSEQLVGDAVELAEGVVSNEHRDTSGEDVESGTG